jgi:hypothetical protein
MTGAQNEGGSTSAPACCVWIPRLQSFCTVPMIPNTSRFLMRLSSPRSVVASLREALWRAELLQNQEWLGSPEPFFESKYSIHDLSRCQGAGDANLARFNMPLELGIAMARRYLARRAAERHDWLVMVPTGHEYGRFISDLAGFDPVTHDGSERGLVVAIMPWLATRVDAIDTLSPQQVLTGLPEFKRSLRTLRSTWGHWPPWADVVLAALRIAKQLGR